MRRLARWTLNALTALSLLLCVGTVGLWARSYVVADKWRVSTSETNGSPFIRRLQKLAASHGELQRYRAIERIHGVRPEYAERVRASLHREDGRSFTTVHEPGQLVHPGDGFLGLDLYHTRVTVARSYGVTTTDTLIVTLPLWLPSILFAILPACSAVGRLRRRRRRRSGLCPGCGYDMRATPAKCPECGRAADPPAAGAV